MITHEDFDGRTTTLPPSTNNDADVKAVSTPFLAKDKVRHVGEIIAAVVAPTRYIAEDLIELVEVEYESLPAYNDVEDALSNDASLLHEEVGSNVYYRDTYRNGNVDAAFKDADVIVEEKIRTGRTSASPMETRGVIAEWGWDEKLTVWSSTQMPFPLRTYIATHLKLPEQMIRVVAPTVGGGFVSGWVCPESQSRYALTVTGPQATVVQIRFQRIINQFSCSS